MRRVSQFVLTTVIALSASCSAVAPPGGTIPANLPQAAQPESKPTTRPDVPAEADGDRSRGKRVVFVCDATGTMILKIATLKQMLVASVAALEAGQTFNVIFFRDGPRLLQFSPQPLPADAPTKWALDAFLKRVDTVGATDPLPALEAAFKQSPDVVYLLTDGELNQIRSYQEVADAINRLNANQRVRVDTILLDGEDEQAAEFLRSIAEDNGGNYASVRAAGYEIPKVRP